MLAVSAVLPCMPARAGVPRASSTLSPVSCPRIADPKLASGAIPVSYLLGPVGQSSTVTITVRKGTRAIRTVFSGPEVGAATPKTHTWDGKNALGQFVDPGSYLVHVQAQGGGGNAWIKFDVNVVRLGITEMQAQPVSGTDTWPMVYFLKGSGYAFYATPAIHQYLSVKEAGDVSDLDLNSGAPRPAPALWTNTATPPLEGGSYEDDSYDFPMCYLAGRTPKLQVTFGASATSATTGASIACGYPVAGWDIRCQATDGAGSWSTSATAIQPGGTAVLVGPALPAIATRTDRSVKWTWQYRPSGGGTWTTIPGALWTAARFYTNIGTPVWATGASGTQYSGPWVEAAEYLYTFETALSIPATSESKLVEAFMKGYFGQSGSLPSAIEGVIYDCYPMGGDGGASHYYTGSSTQLSRLLNAHANGVYVNCSDVASTTSTMLGMLGVQNVRMLYLGYMDLRAIWGIGTPDYTLDLWGGGSHAFSYHHIVTRDGGSNVSDACLWVDEDGNPDALPGTPGYNCDRPWASYMALAAHNTVSKSVDPLPLLQ